MNPRTALILAGLALVVGVVGLVIGISAKNGNKSDQDIADATKAQLEQQLGTTASQVQGAEQAQASKEQSQANRAAATTASVNKQLRGVRASLTQLQNSVNTLNTTTATQGTDIKNLQKDVDKLDTRVSNLGG
jgi:chromosome segregation ATPase